MGILLIMPTLRLAVVFKVRAGRQRMSTYLSTLQTTTDPPNFRNKKTDQTAE